MATEIWSDLHQNIEPDSQGALRKVINVESVRTSLDNILGTSKGERTFLPEFGSSLKDLIFEPINDYLLNQITSRLRDEIEIWDNRVIVTGINVNTDPDRNAVKITVMFNIRSYAESFTTVVTVTR